MDWVLVTVGILTFILGTVTLLALALASSAAFWGLAAAILDQQDKYWRCEWNGRQLMLAASPTSQSLWIDGHPVALRTASLPATLEAEVDGYRLVAEVATEGVRRVGRIYANGRWIGGVVRGSPPPRLARAPEPSREPPRDERWALATPLLADLARSSRLGATEAASHIEQALRIALARIERLTATEGAHTALGTEPLDMDAVRALLEADVTRILDELRSIHLLSLTAEQPPDLDRIEDLVARIEAEAEVEEAGRLTRGAATPTPKIRTRGPLPDRAS